MKPHIIYTRYDQPVIVQVLKDGTKQWDFSGSTYGDLARADVDTFAAGKELEIVGQAEHPLGHVFLMSSYAMGFADVTGQPHKPWGVLATQVKQIRLVPLPEKRKLFGGIIPAGGKTTMNNNEPNKTPAQRGVRTFVQTVGATVVAFLYGLWQLPGVSDYVHNFVATQGFSLLLGLAALVGIPAGLIAYFQNKAEQKK